MTESLVRFAVGESKQPARGPADKLSMAILSVPTIKNPTDWPRCREPFPYAGHDPLCGELANFICDSCKRELCFAHTRFEWDGPYDLCSACRNRRRGRRLINRHRQIEVAASLRAAAPGCCRS